MLCGEVMEPWTYYSQFLSNSSKPLPNLIKQNLTGIHSLSNKKLLGKP